MTLEGKNIRGDSNCIIGDPAKLKAVGVEPKVDLPGVGLNFQDHYLTFSVFRAKPETESFDDFIRGDPAIQKQVYDEWELKGTGPLATNGIEAGVKIRPTEDELKEFSKWPCPQFNEGWKSYFENKPDKPVMHYSVIAGWFGDHMLMFVPILLLSNPATSFGFTDVIQASREVLHHVP
jgi:alcohol oxidase